MSSAESTTTGLPLTFHPLVMERVWGGRSLETEYGRTLPKAGVPYGESWELVDRAGEQSVVTGGPFENRSLHDLWTNHREPLFGGGSVGNPSERFPLLIKILDARDTLSIQVHPPASIAPELGGEPKTEMWVIAHAEPDACLYVGLKAGVTRSDFEKALADGSVADVVHRIPVKAGDFIFIPSGRLHAIGAGLVIFEIQQNSDTTYRVFDWNRVGLDGKPRDLHVQESLACIDFTDVEPSLGVEDSDGLLVSCAHFIVHRHRLDPGASRPSAAPALIGVVQGSLHCGGAVFGSGDFFWLPPDGPGLLAGGSEGATYLHVRIPTEEAAGIS